MDSYNINKNPFKFKEVKRKIDKKLEKYKNSIIIKIPVVSEVIYGRKVV